MNKALDDMLAAYHPLTPLDWQHAVREVVQEIALLGFWRCGFFDHAAFYGGTALRIFHGLNRFSEDLDFSLLHSDHELRLESALSSVETELAAWGFSFQAESKSTGDRTGIESAFLKGNTRMNLLQVGIPKELSPYFPQSQKIAIKLELDTNPPPLATTEIKTHLLPTPFQVRVYDLPSLFAGKVHALLYRSWKNRVKGRDFYDFVWYISRNVPVRLAHLEARIAQSPPRETGSLDIAELKTLLRKRIKTVDLTAASGEVRPFLQDPRELSLWSEDFFEDLISRLKAI